MADIVRATYYITDVNGRGCPSSRSAAKSSATSARPATLLVVAGLLQARDEGRDRSDREATHRLIHPDFPTDSCSPGDTLMSPSSQIHAKISGPIVMIGFGSIGKGTCR